MIDKKHIDDLTMAYIYSYDKAMAETRNSNFAVQIAMGVTMAVNVERQRERMSEIDPFKMLIENLVGGPDQEDGEGAAGAEM